MSRLDQLLQELPEEEAKYVKPLIKSLMLGIYASARNKTRNEYELDELFSKAVDEL